MSTSSNSYLTLITMYVLRPIYKTNSNKCTYVSSLGSQTKNQFLLICTIRKCWGKTRMEGKEGYQSRVSLTVRCGSRINQAKASRHLTSQTLMRLRSDHRCKKKKETQIRKSSWHASYKKDTRMNQIISEWEGWNYV